MLIAKLKLERNNFIVKFNNEISCKSLQIFFDNW